MKVCLIGWMNCGAKVYRTDQMGEIIIKSDEKSHCIKITTQVNNKNEGL